MKFLTCFLCILLLGSGLKGSQEEKDSKLDVSGYVSGMPSLFLMYYQTPGSDNYSDSLLWQALLHNRININWYPSSGFTASLQIRNQFITGDFVKQMETEKDFIKDNYALPLHFNKGFRHDYLLSLAIDRAWIQYTYKNLEIKAGRQRINWGQTFVWNPNDIFNNYNFFDFDYPERPGADALRIQYYPSYSSSIDLAAKVDSAGNITGGGLVRFTKWNTEFQFLGAYYDHSNALELADGSLFKWEDRDLVGGAGFSAGIKSVSLRGEMSYLYSLKENADSTNQFMTSITLDYTLPNNLGMMFEFLYVDKILNYGTFNDFYGSSQSLKNLGFTNFSLFGQLSYPITPILTGTLGGMYFFDKNLTGVFLGPSLELSLGDNLSLSTFIQLFAYKVPDYSDKWTYVNFGFLRLKWNF